MRKKIYKAEASIDGVFLSDLIQRFELSERMDKCYYSGVVVFRMRTKDAMSYNLLKEGNILKVSIYVCTESEGTEVEEVVEDIFNIDCLLVGNLLQLKKPIKTNYNEDDTSDFSEFIINFIDNNTFKNSLKKITRTFFDTNIESVIKTMANTSGINLVSLDAIENKTRYDQIAIPNLTFNQALSYLDRRYGLYSGIPILNYSSKGESNNIDLEMFNLNKRIKSRTDFTLYSLVILDNERINQLEEEKLTQTEHPIFRNLMPVIAPKNDYDAYRLVNLHKKKFVIYPDDKPVDYIDINVGNDFIKNNEFLQLQSNYSFKEIVDSDSLEEIDNIDYKYLRDSDNMKRYFHTRLSKTIYKLNRIDMKISNDYFMFSIKPGNVVDWKINDDEYINISGKYFIDNIIRVFHLNNFVPSATNMVTSFSMHRANLFK
ncbi:MAG: hypothetical protein WDA59_06885 [Methanofastidiosum sp.]